MGILADTETLTKQNVEWANKVTLTEYKVGNCDCKNSSSSQMKKRKAGLNAIGMVFSFVQLEVSFYSFQSQLHHCTEYNESALKRGGCIWRDNNKHKTSQEKIQYRMSVGSRYELE